MSAISTNGTLPELTYFLLLRFLLFQKEPPLALHGQGYEVRPFRRSGKKASRDPNDSNHTPSFKLAERSLKWTRKFSARQDREPSGSSINSLNIKDCRCRRARGEPSCWPLAVHTVADLNHRVDLR